MLDQRLGQNVFGLGKRKPQQGVDNLLAGLRIHLDVELGVVLYLLDDSAKKGGKVVFGRQIEINHRQVLFKLGRHLKGGTDNDNRLVGVLHRRRNLAQPANHGYIVGLEKMMKVLEDIQGRLDMLNNVIERNKRVLRRGVPVFL